MSGNIGWKITWLPWKGQPHPENGLLKIKVLVVSEEDKKLLTFYESYDFLESYTPIYCWSCFCTIIIIFVI